MSQKSNPDHMLKGNDKKKLRKRKIQRGEENPLILMGSDMTTIKRVFGTAVGPSQLQPACPPRISNLELLRQALQM